MTLYPSQLFRNVAEHTDTTQNEVAASRMCLVKDGTSPALIAFQDFEKSYLCPDQLRCTSVRFVVLHLFAQLAYYPWLAIFDLPKLLLPQCNLTLIEKL